MHRFRGGKGLTSVGTLFGLLLSILALNGCATKPESVHPAYVSHVSYLNWDCDQLAAEQLRLVAALSSASDAQRQARGSDVAGWIFLCTPVATLSGGNQASNIARLKGELDALQRAMIDKKCAQSLVPAAHAVARNRGLSRSEARIREPYRR